MKAEVKLDVQVKFRHFEPFGSTTAYIFISGRCFGLGCAQQHPNDTWDSAIGRKVAFGRAIQSFRNTLAGETGANSVIDAIAVSQIRRAYREYEADLAHREACKRKVEEMTATTTPVTLGEVVEQIVMTAEQIIELEG